MILGEVKTTQVLKFEANSPLKVDLSAPADRDGKQRGIVTTISFCSPRQVQKEAKTLSLGGLNMENQKSPPIVLKGPANLQKPVMTVTVKWFSTETIRTKHIVRGVVTGSSGELLLSFDMPVRAPHKSRELAKGFESVYTFDCPLLGDLKQAKFVTIDITNPSNK